MRPDAGLQIARMRLPSGSASRERSNQPIRKELLAPCCLFNVYPAGQLMAGP